MSASELTHKTFTAEQAISPTGERTWVVIDDQFDLHTEAVAYLASLQARDASFNTQRAYSGRIALYLSYSATNGVVWNEPTMGQLARFLRWLVDEPLPARGRKAAAEPRHRTRGTANAIVGTICEFLRFGAVQGWVPDGLVSQLTQPKYLHYTPPGFDPGEQGEYRTVRARTLKFRVAVEGYEWLTDEQIDDLISHTRHARDRFLVTLLAVTGARIGEVLGLRREDLHLLSNSVMLGCRVEGPHIHIRRRQNANGALAKARQPRSVHVTDDVAALYADYQYERDRVPDAASSDMVFVNLFRGPVGQPMKYGTAKELFDRLAKKAGFTARPHMLRHSAITRWVKAGTRRDVVQAMAGHVSPQSMEPYIHTTDEEKRAAVEAVAAMRRATR